jgi:DNA-binding MarR family transcriptional regulator
VLTDAGFEVLKQAAPGHVRAVRRLLIDVLTPEERDAVASGLGRVRDRILEQAECPGVTTTVSSRS